VVLERKFLWVTTNFFDFTKFYEIIQSKSLDFLGTCNRAKITKDERKDQYAQKIAIL